MSRSTATVRQTPAAQQNATALKINTIRAKARGITLEELAKSDCPTCGKPAVSPFRRYNNDCGPISSVLASGIREGCIDAHHHGHLTPISDSNSWHTRPEAAAMRRADLAWLQNLGGCK